MRRANSLVGLLVVVATLALLMVAFMRGNNMFGAAGTGSPRADGKGTTIPGLAMARSHDIECRSNLSQMRMKVGMVHDEDPDGGKWPATLQETNLGSDFYKCPLGGEPYKYDPGTGELKCVHPGHEKY